MDGRYHSFWVGLFVIGFAGFFLLIVLWLTVGLTQKHYKQYVIYFDESVSGLSVNSNVEYNGVVIGHVSALAIEPDSPNLVRVLLSIESTTPITPNTAATLTTHGLTGIALISLRVVEPSQLALLKTSHDYPTIPTTPSLFFRLDLALTSLMKAVKEIGGDVHALLSPEMIQHSNEMVQNIGKAAQSAQTTFDNMNQIMPQLLMTIDNFGDLIQPLRNLNKEIQENPAVLIRGKTMDKKGPGE